ncbi:MAG: hypothetical protein C0518_09850 [Opitutus sp.]|nr:hypothetical protein [Opitutus sp.]
MSDSIKQFVRGGVVLAALVALAWCGYWLHFTQYMAYDDEGYVLWSYRNYIAHGSLYADVFSQYGPFPYVLYHVGTLLTGGTMDTVAVRWLNLGYWLVCAGVAGHFVRRQTGSAGTGVAAATLTFLSLIVMISEPGHPGGLLAAITAVGTLVAANAVETKRPRRFAIATALTGVALLLSKINVGVFFCIAAGAWLALHTKAGSARRTLFWLVALGSVGTPLALMRTLQHEQWVMIFAFVVAAGALALLALIAPHCREEASPSDWLAGIATAGSVAALVVAAVWARGTPLGTLWQGLVVEPLRHPLVYVHPLSWPVAAPWLAAAGLAAALWHARKGDRPAWWTRAIAGLRLAALAWLGWISLHAIDFSLTSFGLRFGAPLIWLMAVPLQSGPTTPAQRARLWVAWVAVWQLLQAYPVAGSQTAWGGFLWFPVALVGGWEAVRHLAADGVRLARCWRGAAALSLAIVGSVAFGRAWAASYERYHSSQPLGLPGAEKLRLTDDYRLNLRILTRNAARHGNTLFSYPGMFSFNVWSGRPSPTLANVTHWFSLLDERQQQAIIDRLEADPRAVVIVQSYLINFLVVRDLAPRGRLHDYLLKNFAAAFRLDTYEFWVRRGRTIAADGTARFVRDAAGVHLEVIPEQAGDVAIVELQPIFGGGPPLARFAVSPHRPWNALALAADGTARAPGWSATAPVRTGDHLRLSIPLPTPLPVLPRSDYLRVVLYARDGREIETLRFAH